jgi:hypothetical protein
MSTKTLTPEQIADAEAYGLTAEQYIEKLDEAELAPGTYAFKIEGGKVEVSSRENTMKDSFSVNINLRPLDSNGVPTKRYGLLFMRLTVPVAHGQYTPNSVALSVGMAAIKWLAVASGVSQAQLVNSFKSLQFPVALIGKSVVANYSRRADKNDPTKTYPEFKGNIQTKPKLSPLKPDGNGSASAGEMALANSTSRAAEDASIPF